MIEEKIGTDPKTNETEREKGVIEDIENIVSSAYQGIDEEKKSQVIESIQGILNTIEKK